MKKIATDFEKELGLINSCALHSFWETLDFKCPMEVYDKEQYELIINQGKSINKINTCKKVGKR